MNGAKAPETSSPVLQEKTITPETLPTVVGADEGYDGLSQVTVNPDTNLKAENIRSGKTIFGVEGAFTGGESNGLELSLIDKYHTITAPRNVAINYGRTFPIEVSNITGKLLETQGYQYVNQVDYETLSFNYGEGCYNRKFFTTKRDYTQAYGSITMDVTIPETKLSDFTIEKYPNYPPITEVVVKMYLQAIFLYDSAGKLICQANVSELPTDNGVYLERTFYNLTQEYNEFDVTIPSKTFTQVKCWVPTSNFDPAKLVDVASASTSPSKISEWKGLP